MSHWNHLPINYNYSPIHRGNQFRNSFQQAANAPQAHQIDQIYTPSKIEGTKHEDEVSSPRTPYNSSFT